MYVNQGMGVGAFRRAFGGRSNAKGSATPEHHAKVKGLKGWAWLVVSALWQRIVCDGAVHNS